MGAQTVINLITTTDAKAARFERVLSLAQHARNVPRPLAMTALTWQSTKGFIRYSLVYDHCCKTTRRVQARRASPDLQS